MTLQDLSTHTASILAAYRSKHNVSLTHLARELGVSRSQTERVLEGYCEDLQLLEKVLECLGYEVGYLVQMKEKQHNHEPK